MSAVVLQAWHTASKGPPPERPGTFQAGEVKHPEGGVPDGASRPVRLIVGPGMAWPGRRASNRVPDADAVDDVGTQMPPGRPVPVPGQVGKGHGVVGQHGVGGTGRRCHHAAQDVGSVHRAGVVAEPDTGGLRHAIEVEKHVRPALGKAQLADVGGEGAGRGLGEPAPHGSLVRVVGQAGDGVAFKASMQAGAGQRRVAVAQASEHVVERHQGAAPEPRPP